MPRIKASEEGKIPEKGGPSIMEKKEKFLEAPKTEKGDGKSGLPAYLIVLLLVLGILAGLAIALFLLPQQPQADNGSGNGGDDTNTINDTQYRTVPITMLYSGKCGSCRQTNTIEELFIVRNIPYSMKKVDAESGEGKRIVERFGVESVPTAIIDVTKMEFYPSTKASFDSAAQVIRKANGAYVVPELNLNANYYFPVYFLEKQPGFCTEEKPSVAQFDDYYTEQNAKGRRVLYDFAADFNELVDYRYSFAQSASADTNAVLANLFLMCASQQGKYWELERSITGIYCNNPFKGDETILTGPEIDGCWTISSHYGKPLTQIELDIALGRTTIDTNEFLACIGQKEVLYNNAKKAAEDLGIGRPGTFLIDCQETTGLSQIKGSFCAIHPEMEKCSAGNENG